MSNITEVQNTTITTLKLPKIAEFKAKQELIVKENPFIEIVDNATHKQAKANRTALKTARTGIQKGSKVLNSRINDFKRNAKDIEGRLISITSIHEEKQQAEIDRWEAKKAEEKAEKLRLEQEARQKKIDEINEFFLPLVKMVMVLSFPEIESWKQSIGRQIREREIEGGFGEVEELFISNKNTLNQKLAEKIGLLESQEAQRIENERLAKERVKLKAEKDELDRLAKIEADKKAKEDAIRAEAQRKLDQEKAEFEAKKQAEQKAIDDEKKRLEKIEADRLAKIEQEKLAKEKAEQEKKEAEEKAIAKAKEEAKLKAELEAEQKRQLALRPDKEKLETAINQISFPIQELSSSELKQFQQDAIQSLEDLKEELINKLQNL